MWIQMKTYKIKSEEDICEALESYKTKEPNNIYELKMIDVEKQKVHKENNQEFISLKANMVLLKQQKSDSSTFLSRENCKNYIVHLVNIKNKEGEHFSNIINNLSHNDRILLIDGIVMKSPSLFFNNTLTMVIRPENNSSVILLKCGSLFLKKTNSIIEKNLTQLTGPGCYSLFGNVFKTMKYTDDDFMLLRIQCFDKSCIKTYKYPNFVCELKNVLTHYKKTSVQYDFSSNRVDILVKNPCSNFTSLVPDQRIVLNNVKVKYSNDLELFLLLVKGDINNLSANPIETISVKSLRPPMKQFPIPNDLKLGIGPIKKPISSEGSSVSNNRLNELNTIVSTSEQSPSRHDVLELSDSSIDDYVNVLPNYDFPTPRHVNNREPDVTNDLFCNYNNPVTTKISKFKSQTDNVQSKQLPIRSEPSLQELSDSSICDNIYMTPYQYFSSPKHVNNKKTDVNKYVDVKFCKNNNLVSTKIMKRKSESVNNAIKYSNFSDKNTNLKKRKISSPKENSPHSSSNGSCSPLFFNTPTTEVATDNLQDQSKNLPSSNDRMDCKTQCIGPCRLIHIEPSIFDDEVIVSGYCSKCIAFIQKSFIKCIDMEFRCPKCTDIVHLTFYLKMTFLYGKNYGQAIEVCCYSDNAKRVIKKLTKKNITLENYLSNQDCRVLVVDTLKSLIINKTKINIVVCESVTDKTSILLSIDTKYVVTVPTY